MRAAPRTLLASVAACVLAMGLSSGLQAQVYKWTDADGKVHYGSKPPEGARANAVEDRSSTHGKVGSEAKAGKEADKRHKKRMAELDKELANKRKNADKVAQAEAKKTEAYERCVAARRPDCVR